MTTTLQTHLVSITEVRMSPDLRHATVFVKPLLGQDEEAVLKALRQNTAFLQREVAHRVRMKYAAKLKFIADESFDEGTHIDRLLRSEKVAQDLERANDRARTARGEPMTGDGCRAELFSEAHREPLKAACAEDRDIWADLRQQFRPGRLRREHRSLHLEPAQPHLRPVRRRRARRHVELSRHRRQPAGAGDRRHLLPPAPCAAPASTAASRT